jgi:hypothetical protein
LGQAGLARHIMTSMWHRTHTAGTISLPSSTGSTAGRGRSAGGGLGRFTLMTTRRGLGSKLRFRSRSSPSGAQFADSSSSSSSAGAARSSAGSARGSFHVRLCVFVL